MAKLPTHSELIEDGFVYLARQIILFSTNERRLYAKNDVRYVILTMQGVDVIASREYVQGEHNKAYDYMRKGEE